MKVNLGNFLKFLKLVNVTGEVGIKEVILEGSKKELKTYAKAPSGIFALKAVTKGDYSELETVGIDDLETLRKLIDLNQKVEDGSLEKKENKIIIKNKNVKTTVVLRNPKYILTELKKEVYEQTKEKSGDNKFTLTKDDITQLSKYYDIMKGKVYIKGTKNTITFIIGENENQSEVNIKIKETVKEFEVNIAGFFIELLNQIADDVVITTGTDKPILILNKSDDYEVEYLLAPLKRETKQGE
jgi:hypothetical protein